MLPGPSASTIYRFSLDVLTPIEVGQGPSKKLDCVVDESRFSLKIFREMKQSYAGIWSTKYLTFIV